MATSHAPHQPSFEERHHFLLRKLHSLSGIIPVGAFLVEHMITNSAAFFGGSKQFNQEVQFIQDLPLLPFLEVFGIFLPLAFHAIYGIKIALSGRPNSAQYPYMANRRYTLQRVSGYIAFIFIIVHLAKFRFAHLFGWTSVPFAESGDYFQTTYNGLMEWRPWGMLVPAYVVYTFYLIGLAAACYHFANGMWTFCISWGITVGVKAQQRVGYAAAVVGIGLFSLGSLSLYGFAMKDAREKVDRTEAASAHVDAAVLPPGSSD